MEMSFAHIFSTSSRLKRPQVDELPGIKMTEHQWTVLYTSIRHLATIENSQHRSLFLWFWFFHQLPSEKLELDTLLGTPIQLLIE